MQFIQNFAKKHSLGFFLSHVHCPITDERGLYPDAKSCTKFFECIDMRLEESECPEGTFFDQSKILR